MPHLSDLLAHDWTDDDAYALMQKPIDLLPVDSSLVTHIGYDADRRTLRVVYRSNGAAWDYSGVPLEAWERLRTAASVGKQVLAIKAAYVGRKVE